MEAAVAQSIAQIDRLFLASKMAINWAEIQGFSGTAG